MVSPAVTSIEQAAQLPRELRLDPLTGDYDGAVIRDLANAVYLRIVTPLGSYWADPALGSKLHLLQREKELQRVQLLAEQYARDALQPLLDDGRAQDIRIQTTAPANGRLNLLVEVYQAGQRVLSFERHVQVMQS